MFIRRFAAIAAASLFAGCAIHPVPEDVTGVDTYHIVRQIRCESRQAVIDFIMRELHIQADRLGDPIAQRLVIKYETDPESIRSFKPDAFPPGRDYEEYRRFYNIIYGSAIAYNFDLTMTENNNLGTVLNFLGPWVNKFTLNVTGDVNRERSNERQFTVTDTFQFLLANLNAVAPSGARYCDGQVAGPNYMYPIAGQIGVYKSVKTFFELTMLGGLSSWQAKPGEVGAPTMTDNLAFTTLLDLSATPKVVFTQVGSGFQLADASLTGMVARKDVHKVTVGLAVTPSGAVDVGPLRGFLFSGPGGGGRTLGAGRRGIRGPVLVGNRVTGTGATTAEQLALLAIDQVKSREIQLIPSP